MGMQFRSVLVGEGVGGFTKTELRPPDLAMGRTSIALALLLYAYKNGGCRQNDKDIFEINHRASLCHCVCEYVYMHVPLCPHVNACASTH